MKDKEFVLVTEYFHPDTASTGQLMTDLALGLHDRGLDISVLTSQPNYHGTEDERQPSQETHQGVPIRRIPGPQVKQSSLISRLFNWIIFNFWVTVLLTFRTSSNRVEIIFPAITPGLSVVTTIICKIKGWEYTYICYDLYPDQAIELDYIRKGGIIDIIWSKLTVWSLMGANHIVSNGPVMSERIYEKSNENIDKRKINVIHNWEDSDFISPKEKINNPFSQKHNLVEPFTLLYSGNISGFHDLETVVKAIAQMDKEVVFMIIGEGEAKDNIVSLAERLGVRGDSVKFLPYQPYEDLPNSLTSGDVSLVTVREGFEGVCVSSKLYTALAAGEPVLVIAKSHDDESLIVDNYNAGIQVEQEDIEGVKEAISTWMENQAIADKHGANAREALEENFTKKLIIDEYYQMLANTNEGNTKENKFPS